MALTLGTVVGCGSGPDHTVYCYETLADPGLLPEPDSWPRQSPPGRHGGVPLTPEIRLRAGL
ncbi:MAG: hypothetical protein R3D25_05835 [Geminicoccaceae bacterium]